ncbi:MAG TPA: hypothetical protein PKI83_05395, partial [Bacteroidales bacterium]|nr:hypothetical protein [Bacteroidales bacterium]
IRARLMRIEQSNFGDSKSIGEGLYELRLHFGSGYRIYYGQIGDEIWQPGPYDTLKEKNVIGHLTSYAPIYSASSNTVDAALFSIKPGVVYSDEILDIGKLSSPFTYRELKPGDTVWKSGRTTGLTKARVVMLNASTKIYYTINGVDKQVLFDKQIVTEYMCEGGDSGSLVVINVNGKWLAVGLLFAGSCSTTVINPIDEVIKKLPIPITFG